MCDANKLSFLKLLYNHNPFYLISAALVLYGFRGSIPETDFAANPWLLVSVFACYTTLLAFTGWLIVKFGRVWDDARSIFMVLLLLFMALSTSIDCIFVSAPQTGLAVAFAGFGLAVAIISFLTISLGIKFGWLFRFPLFAMLAISFFFPYVFTIKHAFFPSLDDRYIILIFPFIVSLSILSLIPAIRQTKNYARKNGTPWRWPMYPYSIFVLLVVGLIGRTALLSLSFDASIASGMLGTWLFVPVLFAVLWLMFEVGAAEEIRGLQFLALAMLPVSLLLAVAWPAFSNTEFYDHIQRDVGSPVWLALVAMIVIYLIAWLDGIKAAGAFLVASMCFAAILKPNGEFASGLSSMQAWPCMSIAIVAVCSNNRIRQSKFWFLSSIAIAVPSAQLVTNCLANFGGLASLAKFEIGIVLHVALLLALLVGCVFRDSFSVKLSVCLALVWPLLTLAAVAVSTIRFEYSTESCAYCVLLSFAAFMLAYSRKSRLNFAACLASLAASFVSAIPLIEVQFSSGNQKLVRFMLAGFICFLLGFIVSAIKAGWTKSTKFQLGKLFTEFRDAFIEPGKSLNTEQSV